VNSNSKWVSKPGNSSQGKVGSGSKNGPRKSYGNAFGYSYASSELQVLLLTRSCFPAVCMKKCV
jgi:G patch domain-containing protein 2